MPARLRAQPPSKLIPIARPILGPEEGQAVQAVLDSGELVQGRWVAEFERAFAEFCGVDTRSRPRLEQPRCTLRCSRTALAPATR